MKVKILLIVSVLALIAATTAFFSISRFSDSPHSSDSKKAAYTQDQLTILSATPQGLIENRDQFYAIEVIFNQPMVPLEALPEGEGSGPLSIQPPITGKYRWQGSNTLIFIPSRILPWATRFTVTIPAGLRSLSGIQLSAPFQWSFETPRPAVLYSSLEHSSTNVSLQPSVFILFNQPVSFTDLQSKTYLTGSGGITTALRISHPDSQDIHEFSHSYSLYHSEHFNIRKKEDYDNIRSRLFKFQPVKHLMKATPYVLRISEGLRGTEGNLPMAEDFVLEWVTHNDFAVESVVHPKIPGDVMTVQFTTQVDESELMEKIRISPAADIHYIYNSWSANNQAIISFNLLPQTTYTVRLDPSLTDIFGQTLQSEFTTTFRTGDYAANVYFATGLHTVESYVAQNFYVWALNPNRINLKIADLDQPTLIRLLQSDWQWNKELNFIPWNFEWSSIPKTLLNQTTRVPIYLLQGLKKKNSGVVLVEFLHEPWDNPRRALIQVSDLSITAKFSRLNNLIHVTYLRDAAPVADAGLEIRDENGIVRWQGKTDANGMAQTPGWEKLGLVQTNEYNTPVQYLFVKKNDQVAFASSAEAIPLWNFNLDYNWSPPAKNPITCFVFTNQGIYRPGDPVRIKGITRRLRDDRWTISSGEPLKLEIRDPNHTVVTTSSLTTNHFGAFDAEFTLEPNSPLGHFSVHVYTGENLLTTEYFQVQEFRPVELEVTVSPDKSSYIWGDVCKARLEARYLFGAPMGNEEIKYSITRSFLNYQPPGYEDYFFGTQNEEDHYYRGYGYYGYSATLLSEKNKLDANGQLKIQLPLNHDNHPETSQLIIEGSVTDKNRQSVSGRASVIVHAGEYYIGLKPSTTFHESGKPLSVQIRTILPDGKKVSGKKVTLELVKREWNSARIRLDDGSYEWTSSIVDTVETRQSIVSGEETSVVFTPASAGYYLIRASSVDRRNNTIRTTGYIYVTGSSSFGWKMSNEDRIDLQADKKDYKPGDKARILVKSPYARARALITVEREGILYHKTELLTGNAPTVEIPIRSEMQPNVFVSVILLVGRTSMPKADQKEDIGKPQFKIGYIPLMINSAENKLHIQIEPSRTQFQPGEWVEAELTVRDATGKGQMSEVTFYAEDIGVLNLIGYKTPQPFDVFYKPRPLSVSTYEGRRYVLDQVADINLEPKGGIGGGGGEEGYYQGITMRRDFKACAYWNPSLFTDASGKARVQFQLPDNLTAYRLMAVAHNAASQFGSAEQIITVSKPLMLRPALPRFARAGDEVEAGVIVHNTTGKNGIVNLIASFEGVITNDSLKRSLELKDGENKEIRFRFKVAQIRNAKVSFKAVMGTFRDGIEITLPFRIPTYKETVAIHNSLIDATRTEQIHIPVSSYAEAGLLEFQTSSTALTGLADGVRYLFEYPYGCLEQKTSRVLPILLFSEVVRDFDLPAFRPAKTPSILLTDGTPKRTMEEVVQEFLNEVPSYQKHDGGFGYWAESNESSPFVSAFTMLALTKANQKGYTVNTYYFNRGLQYLKTLVRNYKVDRYGLFYWHMTHALGLYVLAENNYYDAPSAELLFQRRYELPLYARAMLMKAIHYGKGHRFMIEELKRSLLNNMKTSATTVHFEEPATTGLEWTFHSDIRTTAAVLEAFLSLDGEQVPWAEKAVRYLVQYRQNGRWRTTQDNLYVFWALATYYSIFEKELPDFNSQIILEGKSLLNQIYRGRQMKSATTYLPLYELPSGTTTPVIINKKGSGRLYYTLRMTYIPKDNLNIQPRDEGIQITRVYEDLKGNPIRDGQFKAGDLYRVRITIRTPHVRHFVVVEDPLPAGFEAVNVDLATASAQERLNRSGSSPDGISNTFYRSELRDDRVLLFADWLPRGTHTTSYLVRATTYGVFETPPARVEEMYAPEVFGNTANQTITIR